MGFWIFMFICDLLIPVTMIVFGKYFIRSAPKEINSLFGYRTTMSMKNKGTWNFAHNYCGNLWWKCGLCVLIATIIGMIFVIEKAENIVGITGGVICGVQLVFLIGSIVPTEVALKKKFDENGVRRK